MLRKLLCVISGSLFANFGFAQQPMGLQECIELALKNNIALKVSQLAIQTNQNNLEQSKMARLPNLNAGAGQGWNFGRNIDPFTNQFTNDPVNSNNFSINTGVTVFNGFQLSNTIKQNELNLQASQFDVQKAKNDLMLNVANAYLNIVFNKELVQTSQGQLKNTQEQLARTMRLIEAGSLPEANKYDLLSQQATDELNVTNAQNNLSIAILRLQQLMQIPSEQALDVVVPVINEPDQSALAVKAAEIYSTAETTQPDIKSADIGIKSSEVGIEIAKGNKYPVLSVSANALTGYSSQGVNRNVIGMSSQVIGFLTDQPTSTVSVASPNYSIEKNPFGNQLDQNFRQNVNISLTIPIFNRYQVRTAVANAQIRQDQAKLNAQNLRNNLRQTIEQAYVDAVAAQKSFQSSKIRVEALTQNLKVIEQRFELGAANATDYAVAKNNLNNAQSDLLRAKYNSIFRVKVLDFYLGKELSF